MRGVSAVGLLIPHLLGLLLLELAASNASAFQIGNDAASSIRTKIARRENAMHLHASNLDKTDLVDSRPSSRRNVLLTTLSGAVALVVGTSTFIVTQPLARNRLVSTGGTRTAAPIMQLASVEQAVAWIDQNCDRRFLHAVVASDYHFLYRGVTSSKISVINEEPDLLLPETYGSEESVEFFRQLEIVLKDDAVRPSNGHLATTSVKDAAAWGTTAASIWPMVSPSLDTAGAAAANDVHYAWFQSGGLFYPRELSSGGLDRKQIIVDGRDCGKDSLDDALTKESCEVMVAATSGFLAVPVSMEKELRDSLRNSFLV